MPSPSRVIVVPEQQRSHALDSFMDQLMEAHAERRAREAAAPPVAYHAESPAASANGPASSDAPGYSKLVTGLLGAQGAHIALNRLATPLANRLITSGHPWGMAAGAVLHAVPHVLPWFVAPHVPEIVESVAPGTHSTLDKLGLTGNLALALAGTTALGRAPMLPALSRSAVPAQAAATMPVAAAPAPAPASPMAKTPVVQPMTAVMRLVPTPMPARQVVQSPNVPQRITPVPFLRPSRPQSTQRSEPRQITKLLPTAEAPPATVTTPKRLRQELSVQRVQQKIENLVPKPELRAQNLPQPSPAQSVAEKTPAVVTRLEPTLATPTPAPQPVIKKLMVRGKSKKSVEPIEPEPPALRVKDIKEAVLAHGKGAEQHLEAAFAKSGAHPLTDVEKRMVKVTYDSMNPKPKKIPKASKVKEPTNEEITEADKYAMRKSGKKEISAEPEDVIPTSSPAPPAPVTTSTAGDALKGNRRAVFDVLTKGMNDRMANQPTLAEKAKIVKEITAGEKPTMKKALMEHLRQTQPEVHAHMEASAARRSTTKPSAAAAERTPAGGESAKEPKVSSEQFGKDARNATRK